MLHGLNTQVQPIARRNSLMLGTDFMKILKLALKGLFSLLAVTIGWAFICWVLYNEFINRLPEYQRPPLPGIFGIAPAMIGVGLYWGRQVIQRLRG